jgi:signal transduction histidine kinase
MSEEKIYNSIIIENYIQLAKYKYPDLNTDKILLEAGIEPWDLEPGNWFSQKQVDRFQKIIVAKTGNPNIAREAGRYSVADRSGNLIRQAALSLLSPSNLIDIIGKITSKVTKASKTSSNKIAKNKYEIIVEYSPGAKPKKYQCLSTQGYLEAIYFVFYSRFPRIEHVECFFENGERCRYIMSWDPTVLQMLKTARNLLFLITSILFSFSLAFNFSFYAPIATSILSLLAFLVSVYCEKSDLLSTLKKQNFGPHTILDDHNRFYHSANLITFVTAASHEMLAPIQIINLAYQDIGMTLSKYRLVNQELSESLSILDEAVKKLNSVSVNVLNFSKLESELELLPVKFDILIEEIKKKTHFIPSTFNHSIDFSIDDKIDTIECHKNAFVQMVSNLIENSAKYSPQGGRIDVACDLGPTGLTIAVTDNGIGIPKECHEKIFMKFYQINDAEGGCGLGLAFCQETVKQHGGHISVESPVFPKQKRRKGARFIVHIPINR